MFRIAICDDDEYFRIREKQLITEYMKSKSYGYEIDLYSSGVELLKQKEEVLQYDIIFLDINMKELDGIETAKEIRKVTEDIYLVFVTAFIAYAPAGYKVNAVRYLLKDDKYLDREIKECLETILYKIDYEEHHITFEFQEGKKEICLEDLIYIESNLHKLSFYMAGKDKAKYTMYAKLDEIDELLKESGFSRIHKSFLVNFKYVKSVERYQAILPNGKSLAISKARYLETKNEFVCYRGEI